MSNATTLRSIIDLRRLSGRSAAGRSRDDEAHAVAQPQPSLNDEAHSAIQFAETRELEIDQGQDLVSTLRAEERRRRKAAEDRVAVLHAEALSMGEDVADTERQITELSCQREPEPAAESSLLRGGYLQLLQTDGDDGTMVSTALAAARRLLAFAAINSSRLGDTSVWQDYNDDVSQHVAVRVYPRWEISTADQLVAAVGQELVELIPGRGVYGLPAALELAAGVYSLPQVLNIRCPIRILPCRQDTVVLAGPFGLELSHFCGGATTHHQVGLREAIRSRYAAC